MSATILVPLTDTELRERGDRLAAVIREIDELEDAKADAMKSFRDDIEVLVLEKMKLAHDIRMKSELRPAQEEIPLGVVLSGPRPEKAEKTIGKRRGGDDV